MSASNPVIKQTKDYRLVVDVLLWDGFARGTPGYRVINRHTDVCEGEGSVMASAMLYMDGLQSALDRYYDEPLGGNDSDTLH